MIELIKDASTTYGMNLEIIGTNIFVNASATATTVIVAAAAAAVAPMPSHIILQAPPTYRYTHSVSTKTTALLRSLRCGDGSRKNSESKTSLKNDEITTKNDTVAARYKSVSCMAIGMACHYLGYSLARPTTVALFTSKATGYSSPVAYPLAMAFVSPVSLISLLWYGKVLEQFGPKGALKRTTLACATFIIGISGAIAQAQQTNAMLWKTSIPIVKLLSFPLLVFRESYVQLLTSQYWSFMASVLTPNESTKWFAPIAGLTSISSVIGGNAVSFLSERLQLPGTLACTGLALLLSLVATGSAYSIAEQHGFSPTKPKLKKNLEANSTSKRKKNNENHHEKEASIIDTARSLFARVPVLRVLFIEVLAAQSLATLLNVCFVESVSKTIPDDQIRAGWVGKFYALINLITMTLQFGVLPFVMQYIEPKDLWRFTPLISLAFTTFQAVQKSPTLYAISASLLVMKVSEYSARRMLDEMVYVPLDFESRYLGKEIIGVFGYRFGKSAISLSLSILTYAIGQFNLQSLSIFADFAAVLWAKAAWNLSSFVPTRQEAQETFDRKSS